MKTTDPRTWTVLDFMQLLPSVPEATVRVALHREVRAGKLLNPRRGLYQSADRPPLWDPLMRYENVRVDARIPKQGRRGSPRVPLQALSLASYLAARFGVVLEEVLDEHNLGYHFPATFDTSGRIRAVTLSVYPSKRKIGAALGARGEPLRFWELFAYFVGWLPGVVGLPVDAWMLSNLEVNRDHLIESGSLLFALTEPMPLRAGVNAMVKVYAKQESVRAEVRLSGDLSKDVLLDDVRAMLDWAERL